MRTRGLTFLEVLLALSMLGFLMLAGSSMLFALSRTYFSLETGPQFEHHVDGVVEFLHHLATFPDNPNAPPGHHFGWQVSPVSKKPTVSFTINRDVPFFVSEFKPLPKITAYLEYEEENSQFWLVWHLDPQFTDGTPELQYTLLSQWASDIEYGYYDAGQKTWEFELASAEDRKNANARPGRMHLIFERQGSRIVRGLHFNPARSHVLLF